MPWKKNSLGAHVVTKIATPNLRFLCNFRSFFDIFASCVQLKHPYIARYTPGEYFRNRCTQLWGAGWLLATISYAKSWWPKDFFAEKLAVIGKIFCQIQWSGLEHSKLMSSCTLISRVIFLTAKYVQGIKYLLIKLCIKNEV